MTWFARDYAPTMARIPTGSRAIWIFEGPKARAEIGRKLGIAVHSAYKPLLHDVLERGLLLGAREVRITYPVIRGDDPMRFLLEAYPLHDLVGAALDFVPAAESDALPPEYVLERDDGTTHRVLAPVRWREVAGTQRLASCGWSEGDEAQGHLPTPHEEIFEDARKILNRIDLSGSAPYFDRLEFRATIPGEDVPLTVGEECLSIAEALHEDIYFSALEILTHRLDLPAGSRDLLPGQVVPLIRYGDAPRLNVSEVSGGARDDEPVFGDAPALTHARHWLTPAQIDAHLDLIGGDPFAATSRQGRPVPGRVVNADKPPLMAITSGQHANESSPIVGALRAGHDLAAQGVGFTICPLINPDGYALFRTLCAENPRHMHHAARYTAGGNDISDGTDFESEILTAARARNGADVNVNLHGYPSHEWTRPFSGYLPRGFTRWAIPKGFFLILRCWPGYEELGERVLQAAIGAIAGHQAQMDLNREMMARYRRFFPEPDFEITHEVIPLDRSVRDSEPFPVTLITEATDETVYGEDFRIAQETQYRVIMAVAAALAPSV